MDDVKTVASWLAGRTVPMSATLDPAHKPSLRLRPVEILTDSGDNDGRLVLTKGRLVAVLVQLADQAHAELVGSWFLEAGFGPCGTVTAPVFKSLDEAQDWIAARLECEAANGRVI